MDRRHLFVKRPFTKWYHKCMACKTRKMWEPMVKCVNCKMYRHSECTPSDECKQPPAGIFDSMTSLPDKIQQPYQFPYLDVSYDNGDNLGTGQASTSGLIVEKVLTPQNNFGVFNIEKWASFIKIDKSTLIDKKKKNTNKNTPNIVKTIDTDQKALDTGAKTSTIDEKMTNSDNTVEDIIINMDKKTPDNIVKSKTIDQNSSDTDITTIERTKINDNSTPTIVDIPTTSDKKTTASVNTSTADEKTKTTGKKTTDTDTNTPTIDVKTKNYNKNRPTTVEKSTTSSKKMTDKGMNTSIFDEKLTTSDKKMVDIDVNTLILNEKTTTAIGQKPSETGAKTSTMVEKTNRPTTVEKLTATENKMTNIEKKTPNNIVKPATFDQNLTCTAVKIKITDAESKNTDVESLTFDEKNMITNKKSLNEVKKSIVIDKNPLSINIQVSTRTKESVTVEKQLKVTDKRTINNDKKIPTIQKKTLKVDNKTPSTEGKLMKIDKKIPTTAADKKISTSAVKKSPTTTDIRTTPTAEGKRIKPVKNIPTTAEKETLTTVDEKTKNTVKNTPNTSAVKKTTIAVKKSPTTTDIRTSITEGKRIKTVKNIPTTAEKKTLTTVDEKTTNTVKKTLITGTKTSTDKVRSDMNRASERKRTLADAEWSTLECVASERNEYEDTTSCSGNAAMTGRNSAKEEVQPGNTLELRPCDSAESFPNTILRRDSRIAVRPTVSVVQTNEYTTESVLMNNRNEHLSPTNPENNGISSGLAMAHCSDDARPVVAATSPTDRMVQSDLCLDARVACDEMTATVFQYVDPPESRRNTIGPVPEEAEELSVNLAKLFPETKDIPFCGFFFGAQKSFDL